MKTNARIKRRRTARLTVSGALAVTRGIATPSRTHVGTEDQHVPGLSPAFRENAHNGRREAAFRPFAIVLKYQAGLKAVPVTCAQRVNV